MPVKWKDISDTVRCMVMVGFPMWHFFAKWRDPSVIYVLWQFESATATRGHVQSIQINPSQIAIDIRPSAWLVVQSLFTLQTCDWHWQCEKNHAIHCLPTQAKFLALKKALEQFAMDKFRPPIIFNYISIAPNETLVLYWIILDLYSLLGTIFFGCFRFGGQPQ